MAVSFCSDVNYALKAHPGPITVCDASRKCSKAQYTAWYNRAVLQLDNKVPHVVWDLDDEPDKKDCLDEIAEAVENSWELKRQTVTALF